MSALDPKKSLPNRMREFRERRKTAGLVQLNLYADKRDHEAIKRFAEQLKIARSKQT